MKALGSGNVDADFRPIANITAFLQGVCLHGPRAGGAIIRKFSPRGTTRSSFRPKNGRTCVDDESCFGQEQSSWIAIVDHQLGFIESLRYSKLGDAVKALRRQNISNQLIWILQYLYHNQTGVVRDGAGDSRTFDIFSGVRQGCVLSPRLFCAALELAMSEWRLANPHGGVDLGDAMPRLLDLRFADDILIFANTKEEVQNLLDSLVRHLATAGLVLNTSKTVALTTEAQSPSFIQAGDNHMVRVLGDSHMIFEHSRLNVGDGQI